MPHYHHIELCEAFAALSTYGVDQKFINLPAALLGSGDVTAKINIPCSQSEWVEPDDVGEYVTQVYWEGRFEKESSKEWLCTYEDVKARIATYIHDKNCRILVLGCGNSALSSQLYDDGYSNITSADFSEIVIKNMKLKYKESHPRLKWFASDAKNMTIFENNSFDVVLEKSCVDVVANDRGCEWDPPAQTRRDVAMVLREVSRILSGPGSVYLMIEWMQPHFQRNYLVDHHQIPGYGWEHCGGVTFHPIDVGLGYTFTSCRIHAPPQSTLLSARTSTVALNHLAKMTKYRPSDMLGVVHVCGGGMSKSCCSAVLQLAQRHTDQYGWCTKRHVGHNTTDFSVKDVPELWGMSLPAISMLIFALWSDFALCAQLFACGAVPPWTSLYTYGYLDCF